MRSLTIDELERVSGGFKKGGGGMAQLGAAPMVIFAGLSWALEGVAKVSK